MEGFVSINWDKAVDESSSFFPKDVFVNSSAAYHKLHEIPQSPWPNDEQAKKSSDGNVSNRPWNPSNLKREVVEGVGNIKGKFLKIHLPTPFPQKSVLSLNEQKDYLFAIIRVMKAFNTGVPSEPADISRIRDLQSKLKEEIQDFQRFAQLMIQKNPTVYSNVNIGTSKYVNEAWKAHLSNVKQYPSFYKLIGSITLIPKENIKTIDIVLQQTVLELGRIPCQMFPPLNTLIKLQRNHKVINNRYPANVLEYEQVSRDSNAIKLATKYDVEIVITSNAMRSLAGNVGPLFRHSWDIPFTVKEMDVQGKAKKIIVVDEPLPPTEMTAIEKNAFFNRLSIKSQFTNTNRSRFYTFPGSGIFSKKKEDLILVDASAVEDIFGSDEIDADRIDTFGVEKSQSAPQPSPNPPKICESKLTETQKTNSDIKKKESNKTIATDYASSSIATDSDSSEASLIIDTENESSSPQKNKSTASRKSPRKKLTAATDALEKLQSMDSGSEPSKSPKKKRKTTRGTPVKSQVNNSPAAPANLLNVILQDQEKMMQSNRKLPAKSTSQSNTEPENPQDYIPPKMNQNFTYRTWDIQANEKSIQILVRSSVDTAIVTTNEEFRSFLMVPKTEYQPWLGAECLTPREMNEQWIDLRLRPECRLFRVRLDAYTGDFLMAEQKDGTCLETEITFQYGEQFKPIHCLHAIWAVLSSLRDMNLDSGSYLLRHGFHDGICIQVWQSTEKESSSLDLHQYYAAVDTSVDAVRDVADNWLALDPLVVLPIQRALNRPPLTFEPEEESFKKANIKRKIDGKKNIKKGGRGPNSKKP